MRERLVQRAISAASVPATNEIAGLTSNSSFNKFQSRETSEDNVKKTYEKPVLTKRQKLPSITAQLIPVSQNQA